jgi:hypothetical protein
MPLLTVRAMRRLPLLLTLLLALASCEQRETPPAFAYTAPAGPTASRCVEACEIERRQCNVQADNMSFACQRHGQQASHAFMACQATNAGGCLPPPLCMSERNNCTAEYNSCFASCGGFVFREPRGTPRLTAEPLPGRAGAGMRGF